MEASEEIVAEGVVQEVGEHHEVGAHLEEGAVVGLVQSQV